MNDHYTDEYLQALRNLTPAQRWETARRMYWQAREVRAAVLRSQHPDWNEQEIQNTVRRLFMYAGE